MTASSVGDIFRDLLVDAELHGMANGTDPLAWLEAIKDYDWTVEDGGPTWRLEDE